MRHTYTKPAKRDSLQLYGRRLQIYFKLSNLLTQAPPHLIIYERESVTKKWEDRRTGEGEVKEDLQSTLLVFLLVTLLMYKDTQLHLVPSILEVIVKVQKSPHHDRSECPLFFYVGDLAGRLLQVGQ